MINQEKQSKNQGNIWLIQPTDICWLLIGQLPSAVVSHWPEAHLHLGEKAWTQSGGGRATRGTGEMIRGQIRPASHWSDAQTLASHWSDAHTLASHWSRRTRGGQGLWWQMTGCYSASVCKIAQPFSNKFTSTFKWHFHSPGAKHWLLMLMTRC